MGPVWTYWAFPMERICGDIGRNVRSRRFPYKSINHYVASRAQLTQVTLLYNLHDELSLKRPALRERQLDFVSPLCKLTYSFAIPMNLPLVRPLCPQCAADGVSFIQYLEESTYGIACDSV